MPHREMCFTFPAFTKSISGYMHPVRVIIKGLSSNYYVASRPLSYSISSSCVNMSDDQALDSNAAFFVRTGSAVSK